MPKDMCNCPVCKKNQPQDCSNCNQPFNEYRKMAVKGLCGDCAAGGVALENQAPPATAKDAKKGPHSEAWETPGYDGVS